MKPRIRSRKLNEEYCDAEQGIFKSESCSGSKRLRQLIRWQELRETLEVGYNGSAMSGGDPVPVNDWTRVDAGIFHDFHTVWIGQIRSALNEGVLPEGYYALAEQHTGQSIADILTLHARPEDSGVRSRGTSSGGGTVMLDAPPKVRRYRTVGAIPTADRQRSIAIRHVSGHELVALIEVVSPANKDRTESINDFAAKVVDALGKGIHLLIIDLFPPGKHDPFGIHGVIDRRINRSGAPYDLPLDEPLTVVSYVAREKVDAYIEHLAVGAKIPPMPLFLKPDGCVSVPLESTYAAAYAGVPSVWRDVLEGRSGATA